MTGPGAELLVRAGDDAPKRYTRAIMHDNEPIPPRGTRANGSMLPLRESATLSRAPYDSVYFTPTRTTAAPSAARNRRRGVTRALRGAARLTICWVAVSWV